MEPSSLLDRDLLDELNGGRDEVKDSTTFSIKVYYSIEAGEQTGRNITDMVDMGALTRATIHCLEQMTWTEEEVFAKYGKRLMIKTN